MQALSINEERSKSKYLKVPAERAAFYKCSVFFVFALYVMPQYFGIPNPFFDLTLVRIAIIILLIFIICDYTRIRDFVTCIINEKISRVLIPYFVVLLYTMVLRIDINAFLNPFIELLEMYLLIYVIKDSLGTEKTVKLIQAYIYALIIIGFIEMVIQVSPFSFLVTVDDVYTGRFIRGGHYRIMNNCNHSIGYGMLLVTALPFAGYDVEKETYNLFRRPLLLIGIIVNIFATGSRSSLGIMFAEIFLMLILSDKEHHRENIFAIVSGLVAFTVFVFVFQGTAFGKYVLLQITSLIDSFFNTQFSLKYGADLTHLNQSAAYRDLLHQVFKVGWLNPFLGIGRKRGFASEVNGLVVQSIDNFYIAEYIRYAYPGMLSYIAVIIYMVYAMLKDVVKTHSALIRTLFIGTVCYCMHLYIADSLQTLKYLYVLFALYICADKTPFTPDEKGKYFGKRESKYVKK
jgi:hypothetical protein